MARSTGGFLVEAFVCMAIAAIELFMSIIQNYAGDFGMIEGGGVPLFVARSASTVTFHNFLTGRMTGVAG